MTPDAQLLTKQVIVDGLTAIGFTVNVRFNLQRGKIARIHGFVWFIIGTTSQAQDFTIFVRKTAGVERATTPSDLLWADVQDYKHSGTSFSYPFKGSNIMFPKPHRTTGITIQMHCTDTTTARGLCIIYYDIDDIAKGELANKWEKSRQKKYDRRMMAP